MKVLVDSSTLIALAKIGELCFLREYYTHIYITEEIMDEVTHKERPENILLKRYIGDWIKIVNQAKNDHYSGISGLDKGERSLLNYAKENQDSLLILDEKEARMVAKVEGLNYTGTLGLLVYLYEQGSLSNKKAQQILKKLANSDFRMTVELYDWVLEKTG